LCGFIHGEVRDNFIGCVIRRMEQTLVIYDAYLKKPDNKNLSKALYLRGIKSREGANKLYEKANLSIRRKI
jgi:hypothetical protein